MSARDTALQAAQQGFSALLFDARDTDAYRCWLATVQAALSREHVRVAAGDLERVKRAAS